jgi:hypothetical protein
MKNYLERYTFKVHPLEGGVSPSTDNSYALSVLLSFLSFFSSSASRGKESLKNVPNSDFVGSKREEWYHTKPQ